jgi:nucleotide-binding universal stress UspA family protein
MTSFRRILYATDFSDASAGAFQKAIEVAGKEGAELLIAHAYLPPSLWADGFVAPAAYQQVDTGMREEAEKRLAALEEQARGAGITARSLVLLGAPYEAITAAAAENNVDLVILGTHGRTGAARFFLGSVASRVISTAPCPVLTVRAA